MAVTEITSANSIVMIQVEELIPQAVRLEKFSSDAIAQVGEFQAAEGRMGVDGRLAVGQTPKPVEVTINLEANTPSERLLYRVLKTMADRQQIFATTLTVRVPAQRATYTFHNGSLTTGIAMNNLGTMLEKSSWKIIFESYTRQDDQFQFTYLDKVARLHASGAFFNGDISMRETREIVLTNEDGQQSRFMIEALSAREGFELMQDGVLLLNKAGVVSSVLGKSNDLQELREQASVFDLSTLQNANLKKEDLKAFENALLRSVTYVSAQGTMTPINWDNIDQFCANPLDVFQLLKEAFAVNFGFLKNGFPSISQASKADNMDVKQKPKAISRRPTFKARQLSLLLTSLQP